MRRLLFLLRTTAVLLSLLLLLAAASAAAAEELPSWREPLRSQLLAYIAEVTTPGSKDFVPPAERIAAFDLDGTIIAERPLPFVAEVSVAWLQANCSAFARQGREQAALCQAAAREDYGALRRRIEALLTLPYMGMDLEAYRALALKVFETYPNPLKKVPLNNLIYRPQLELMGLLGRRGFSVWLSSGSGAYAMMAISQKYLGVPPERCIGTRYQAEVSQEKGRLVFRRGAIVSGLLNLGRVKARNLKLRTWHGPLLAFGNSGGDEWMLRYAAGSPRRGLALVLNHDDPREFVYPRPGLLALARERGWTVVSMKRDWKRVFD